MTMFGVNVLPYGLVIPIYSYPSSHQTRLTMSRQLTQE